MASSDPHESTPIYTIPELEHQLWQVESNEHVSNNAAAAAGSLDASETMPSSTLALCTLISIVRGSRCWNHRLGAALVLMRVARSAQQASEATVINHRSTTSPTTTQMMATHLGREFQSAGGFVALQNFFVQSYYRLSSKLASSGSNSSTATTSSSSSNSSQSCCIVSAMCLAYLLPGLVQPLPVTDQAWLIAALSFLIDCQNDALIIVEDGMCTKEELRVSDFREAILIGLLACWRMMSTESNCGTPNELSLIPLQRENLGTRRNLLQTLFLILKVAGDDTSHRVRDLIRSACEVEWARPHLIRQGILLLLQRWKSSADVGIRRAAIDSLAALAMSQDVYTSGWIHSSIIGSGAFYRLDHLCKDPTLRLPVARIIHRFSQTPQTRAFVYEAGYIDLLLSFLQDHRESYAEDYVYLASSALVHVASEIIPPSRPQNPYFARPLSEELLSELECNEIINCLVTMAPFSDIVLEHPGSLRSISIKALLVLSEDPSPARETKFLMCQSKVVKAVGFLVFDCLPYSSSASFFTSLSDQTWIDIACGLCTLANILETVWTQKSPVQDPCLIVACKTAKQSGLVRYCHWLAALVFPVITSHETSTKSPVAYVAIEAYRVLAAMAPMLLSKELTDDCETRLACLVYGTLHGVVVGGIRKLTASIGSLFGMERQILLESILKGFLALAQSSPLQTFIVDQSLAPLLRLYDLFQRANLCFLVGDILNAMGIASENFLPVEAVPNASSLADVYSLKRSLVIQSMAFSEIREAQNVVWKELLENRTNEIETFMSLHDGSLSDQDRIARDQVVAMFQDLHAISDDQGGLFAFTDMQLSQADDQLLRCQMYPLCSSNTECEWIAAHSQFMNAPAPMVSKHTNRLLKLCVPSQLLRNQLVPPIRATVPHSNGQFRAIMMPRRQYFSFHREAEWLSHIIPTSTTCIFWTLNFTNSTFHGDFPESLAQYLYLTPGIRGVSFSSEKQLVANISNHDCCLLSDLAICLPPYITHITFDGVLHDNDFQRFVKYIDERRTEPSASLLENVSFLAVKRSVDIAHHSWKSMIDLLRPSQLVAFRCLQSLDLSFNKLGDALCALIIELCTQRTQVKVLDLSGNEICIGKEVSEVLKKHVSLDSLYLASNNLFQGQAWYSLNCSTIKLLDLSRNNIRADDPEQFLPLVRTIITNKNLVDFDLSYNHIQPSVVNMFVSRISQCSDINLALHLEGNTPTISREYQMRINAPFSRLRIAIMKRGFPCHVGNGIPSIDPSPNPDFSISRKPDQIQSPNNQTHSFEKSIFAKKHHMIMVMFSAPLVLRDQNGELHPMGKLNFEQERNIIFQCLNDARKPIEILFDNATRERVCNAWAKSCTLLHYSGHGVVQALPLEDGEGGTDWFDVNDITHLINRGSDCFKCVFVSSCYSGVAGQKFAEAGIPHVVCCQQDSPLKDVAAIEFTRQFYVALLHGKSVKASFEQACCAVRIKRTLKDADVEMSKFVLLGKGDHEQPLFPDIANLTTKLPPTTGLEARNLIQEYPSPAPPKTFLGREVKMYIVLVQILKEDFVLVNIIGETGIGRRSFACSICHYINERRTTMFDKVNRIYFVEVDERWKQNRMLLLFEALQKRISRESMLPSSDGSYTIEQTIEEISHALKGTRALIVFNHVDLLDEIGELNDFKLHLCSICRNASSRLRIIVTGLKRMGLYDLGEYTVRLGPLNYRDSVRLYASLCPSIGTKADQAVFVKQLLANKNEGDALPDSDMQPTSRDRYKRLGYGIPSKIVWAAFEVGPEILLG